MNTSPMVLNKVNWARPATLVLVLVALIGCDNEAPPVTEPPLRPVRVFVVPENSEIRSRSFSGIAKSTQESQMSFRVSGTVVELPVQVGDQLKSGDIIARLNPTTYELSVQQSEANLAQSLANERNAESGYTRVKELYENTNASRNDLDSARASAESARAQVRSARKSLEIAELNRSYTQLTAASDCTVATLDVDLNENINSGEPVARVNCGTGIEVDISVPESLIGGLVQGMPAVVRFNAVPNISLSAIVTELGAASASTSATFPVVVALAEAPSAVRPGMAAEVRFSFASSQANSARIIPAAALINDERGTFVYLALPGGDGTATIARREVTAGELTESGIEILDGLNAGDQVVTAGISVVRPNQIVALPQG